MELLHFRGILRAFFLLQLLLLPLVSSEDNLFQYFINCGSRNPLVKVDDRDFVGDETSNLFSVGNSRTIRIHKLSSPDTIYQTARFYKNPSSFEVMIEENGTYLVRFHFFPFISSEGIDLSKAVFNISARHFLFLSNVGNSSSLPVIKEYFLDISPGKFQIDFVPESTSFAFVNAIELIHLQTSFTFDYANYADALQTVYRVNVGGQNVNDSGALWRMWEQDDNYIVSIGHSEKRDSTIETNEDPHGIDYIAPFSVYESCRLVNSTGSSITNLTWRFPVKRNAKYFVRLHFFDLFSLSNGIYLIFNVFVSELALEFERSNYTSYPAAALFNDTMVDSDNSGYLEISIAPRNDSEEKIAFLNGLEIMAFVSNTSFELPPYKEKHHPPFVVIESVCSCLALVFILMVAFLIGLRCRKFKPGKAFPAKSDGSYWKGKSHSWISENTGQASRVTNFNLKLKMPLSEILAATRNFDTDLLIGEGGFGKVYKGTLQGGIEVAVKRSDFNNGQGVYEFQTEVVVLSKIRHRHLVSLIGYCHEGNEMILVYEFMGKGSLRDHLYNWKSNSKAKNKQSDLTWKQRLEICIGAAKGLHYLHTGSDGGIIHRDVKSTNILLDEEYVAKVADFGLSRSGPSDADHYSTNVKGSFGYLDPEYFKTYQLTNKSDVYSFGVVLLEVLCARQPIVNSTQKEEINLAEWGMHWLNKGQTETIMDPLLVNQINPNSVKKFSQIIEKCLKPEGADRPSMLDVCWDLEYALQLQKTPVNKEPDEDSKTYISSNIALPIENLDSEIFKFHEGSMVSESNKDADLSAINVFSSHNIDGAR